MEKGQKGSGKPQQSIKTASGQTHVYVRLGECKPIHDLEEEDCMPPLERATGKPLQEEDLKNFASEAKDNSSASASAKSASLAMMAKLNATIEKNVRKLKPHQEKQDICSELSDAVQKRLCLEKLKSGNLQRFIDGKSTENLKPDEVEEKDTRPKKDTKQAKTTSPPLSDDMKVFNEIREMFVDEEVAAAAAKEMEKPKVTSRNGMVSYEAAYNAAMRRAERDGK